MRKLKLWCFLFVLFSSFYSSADHLAGGYFEYTYLGNNVYQIDYFFLRDCEGVTAEDPELYIKNDCGHLCENLGEMEQIGNSEVIDYGCGNTCLFGGDRPGYRMLHFRKNVTLNSVCDSWTLSVAISARNEVDYASGADEYYYNYCKINNSVINNSANVVGNPIVLGCSTWGSSPLYTVTQTDGDQLVYDFVPSMIANMIPGMGYPIDACEFHDVNYAGGLSASQSFPSTAPFVMNNTNGSFEFTPTAIGRSYFAVRAREYRNGVQIGEQVVDGMVYVDNCENAGEVTFQSFINSGTNTMTVSSEPGTYCQSLRLTSDEAIEYVSVEAPNFVTYTVNSISAEEVEVTICATMDGMHNFCESETFSFVVNAFSGESEDCLANANLFPDRGYYSIYKEPGEYCPENLFFTNRNPVSGIPMPIYAHAEERIWVGDSMPAIAPFDVQLNEGVVIVEQDLELVAGIEIVLPSCKSGNGCVSISGNQTLRIAPNSCSSDCNQIPLEVTVLNHFDCYHEQLQANVVGDGPFNYKWIIKGDTIITNSSSLAIHDYVSEDSTGLIPYSCEVFDANGNTGIFNGEVLGTKSFYKNIKDHTIYFQYDDNDLFETGWYYAGQPGVDYSRPFFVADSVNTYAPWYGATWIECIVWDRWGAGQQMLYYYNRNLETDGDADDWSFDNGEIWWNGKFPGTNYCAGGAGDIFPYELRARNCLTHIHEEISALIILSCFDGYWSPTEAKSMMDVDYYQELTGETRYLGYGETASRSGDNGIMCFPNPADTRVFIKSSEEPLREVFILDGSGKTVLHSLESGTQTQVDISALSSGMYTIVTVTANGAENRLKLVKK